MWLLPVYAPRPEGAGDQSTAGAPEVLVVSEGTEEDNRQVGLLSPVVLDHDYTVGDAFGVKPRPRRCSLMWRGASPRRWPKARRRYLS